MIGQHQQDQINLYWILVLQSQNLVAGLFPVNKQVSHQWVPTRRGRVGKSRRSPQPPTENNLLFGGPILCYFFSMWVFLLCFSLFLFSISGDLFATFFLCGWPILLLWGQLLGLAPPPIKICAGAHGHTPGMGKSLSSMWRTMLEIV